MANRSYKLLWAAVACCLVGCTAGATGSNTVESSVLGLPRGAPSPVVGAPVAPMRVLQLNLCSSGIAACYTGRSAAEAAAVIRAEIPDLVTLNEICQDDLSTLQQALAEVSSAAIASAFQAAGDRRTGDAYLCRNGRPYGIGLISRWPSVPGSSAAGGIYPSQDTEDPEERAWLCLRVAATPILAVCTTHLAYTKREVAAAQCRYLFGTIIAEMRDRDAAVPVVFGGDLNLGSGDDPDLRSCLPAGSTLVDDGGVQHVVTTPEFVVTGSQPIDLRGTTDHPGLLVALAARTSRRTPSRRHRSFRSRLRQSWERSGRPEHRWSGPGLPPGTSGLCGATRIVDPLK